MLTLSYTIKTTGSEGLYFISVLQLIPPPCTFPSVHQNRHYWTPDADTAALLAPGHYSEIQLMAWHGTFQFPPQHPQTHTGSHITL